jgi:hypothetical protein
MFNLSPHHRRCHCLQDRTTSHRVSMRKPAENGQPMRGKPDSVRRFCFVLNRAAVTVEHRTSFLLSPTIEAVARKPKTPCVVVAASSCKRTRMRRFCQICRSSRRTSAGCPWRTIGSTLGCRSRRLHEARVQRRARESSPTTFRRPPEYLPILKYKHNT